MPGREVISGYNDIRLCGRDGTGQRTERRQSLINMGMARCVSLVHRVPWRTKYLDSEPGIGKAQGQPRRGYPIRRRRKQDSWFHRRVFNL